MIPTARSLFLELYDLVPELVRLAFRAALLLPKHVRALAQMLVVSAAPMLVGAAFGAAFGLPKEVGSLAYDLIQARLRL